MKNEQNQILEEPTPNALRPLPDLSNDPFLLKKEKAAIEFLINNPVPKHLVPKRKNRQ